MPEWKAPTNEPRTTAGTAWATRAGKPPRVAWGTVPLAAAVPALATNLPATSAGNPARRRPERKRLLKAAVTIAPSNAMPNTPPVWLAVFWVAEAMPTGRWSTEPMTADDRGDMVRAIPAPIMTIAGSMTAT